jgi:hypothetical protein
MSSPLDPAVIAEVDARLREVDRMMTPEHAARRLYVIADMIVGGRPQREMFLLAAAVAFAGADACAARDEARQP